MPSKQTKASSARQKARRLTTRSRAKPARARARERKASGATTRHVVKASRYDHRPEKHTPMVNRAKHAKWETGLRGHMKYRDTGLAKATNGEFGAMVMRPREPGIAIAHPGKHRHHCGFQLSYILDGRGRFWIDGIGEFEVEKGDCFYLSEGVLHQALEISDDFELIEITMPEEFRTTNE